MKTDNQTATAHAVGSGDLLGVLRFYRGRTKPKNGQSVIWIWAEAGQITSGDYYRGMARDASLNYAKIDEPPTHWMPWPNNWPDSPPNKVDRTTCKP